MSAIEDLNREDQTPALLSAFEQGREWASRHDFCPCESHLIILFNRCAYDARQIRRGFYATRLLTDPLDPTFAILPANCPYCSDAASMLEAPTPVPVKGIAA